MRARHGMPTPKAQTHAGDYARLETANERSRRENSTKYVFLMDQK